MERGTQNEDDFTPHDKNPRILVHVQDSELNDTERGIEDIRGFQAEIDKASQEAQQFFNASQSDMVSNTHKRYKSGDPRAIYFEAKREQELLLKKQQIQAMKERSRQLKEIRE